MFFPPRIALICAAPLRETSKIKERLSQFSFLIAVDGGINHCHQLGLNPDLLIGDFDSADPHILKIFDAIPQKRFFKDKDHADLELALQQINPDQVEEIVIFGALEGRTDHAINNLILLCRFPGKLFLESEQERLFVINKNIQLATKPGQQISLIPLNGPVQGVSTHGLKWELSEAILDKHFISLSNEAIGSQTFISVKEGDLLCCVNHAIETA